MEEIIANFLKSTLSGFDTMVDDAVKVLTDESGIMLGSWNEMIRLSGYLKPFCLMITAICVLWELVNVAQKMDMITLESGIKIAIKMCLAKVFIDIAPAFLRAVYGTGRVWISQIGLASASSIGQKMQGVIDSILPNISGFMTWLGIALVALIAMLGIKICGLIVQVMAYGRMFEIFVYLVASPLPCAFFPLGDGSGGGFSRITGKFLREFAAICFQGVLMIVVMRIFDVIVGNALVTAAQGLSVDNAGDALTNLIYTMLLGSVALVMAVFKCGSWAKSILDVGG